MVAGRVPSFESILLVEHHRSSEIDCQSVDAYAGASRTK
jgi:hypothetical protein